MNASEYPKCVTCKKWTRVEKTWGDCSIGTMEDFVVADREDYEAAMTRESFGCIHHSAIEQAEGNEDEKTT